VILKVLIHNNIKHLIEYAADRGIRVVPEIDVPGHAQGFQPLVSEGLKYCPNGNDQLYDDPEGNTYKIIRDIFEEMAGLFKDEAIHIGADETHVHGECTLESTTNFENRLLQEIETKFGKTTEGWEEVLYVTKAATPQTVVNAWHNYWAHDIIDTGRRAVESQNSWFYSIIHQSQSIQKDGLLAGMILLMISMKPPVIFYLEEK